MSTYNLAFVSSRTYIEKPSFSELHKIYRQKTDDLVYVKYRENADVPSRENYFQDALDSGNPYLLWRLRNNYTCRESVLYYMKEYTELFDGNFGNPIVFVEYIRENAEPLSTKTVEILKEFGKKFLRTGAVRMILDYESTNSILLCVYPNEAQLNYSMPEFLDLSFVLYLFRNEGFIRHIMESFATDIPVASLFKLKKYLAAEILKYDIGNNTNPSLALSMYCYKEPETFNFYVNGPVNYVYRFLNTLELHKYLLEVYVPTVGKVPHKFAHDWTYCSAKITESVKLLLKLLYPEGE